MRHSVEVMANSRTWLLERLPRWNEEVISHIASEQDLETAYHKKLVISHIYKPFQESLVLIDNDNAEQDRPCNFNDLFDAELMLLIFLVRFVFFVCMMIATFVETDTITLSRHYGSGKT
ncbi:hypothetical protein ACFE04_024258 [Oxalis oulophora]